MIYKSAKTKRSPLKEKPLHNPGESIEQEMCRLLDDELWPVVVCTMFLLVIAGLEWVRKYHDVPPQPALISIMAILAIGYCVRKFVSVRRRFRHLNLGLQGEKTVGQYLEQLREKGYRVFHDIIGKGFNIDHVVLSTTGVYVIETKTFSKPAKGVVSAYFDGEKILVDGALPDRNAVEQVRALSSWLQNMLIETTSRKFPVRGVVLLPGWYVNRAKRKSDVWVLNPKALPSFMDNEPTTLKEEDVALIASRISMYMQDR